MIACVLDASIVARWFVGDPEEVHVRAARALFSEYRTGKIECHAPRFMLLEVANAIWKDCRFGSLAPDEGRTLIQELGVLDLVMHDHEPLLADAFDLALSQGVSAYDAIYLALARKAQMSFWTQDARLARHAAGVVDVRIPATA
jgi:predicted nucleic acid-binding protein